MGKGLLQRIYTQKVDGLEHLTGIPKEKILNVHGRNNSAKCHLCETECQDFNAFKQAYIDRDFPIWCQNDMCGEGSRKLTLCVFFCL